MSFLSDIRAYFDQQIKVIDADLNLVDDALNDEPINQIEANRGYKMVVGDIEMALGSNFHQEDVSINLIIFQKSIRDEISTYDELYCKAQDIKDLIVSRKSQEAYADKNWTTIAPVSMLPSAEITDDKLFSMNLQFNITRQLKYN